MLRHVCGVLAFVSIGFAEEAKACSPLGNPAHITAPAMQGLDTQPPTLEPIPAPALTRRLTEGDGCISQSECTDPGGYLTLRVQATDDMSEPQQIGYRVSITGGTLPVGLQVPSNPIAASPPNAIVLHWFEGDELEAIDFTLSIVPVDLAGNEGAPQAVHIHDPGDGGGCGIGARRHANFATWLMAFVALAGAAHRRPGRQRARYRA
jgi:hypothetical protein